MSDEGVRLSLRPYQVDALDKIGKAELRGCRRQLGVAATGLGKTVIFCKLAQQRGGRTLVLAHRDELILQAAAKVREVWPSVDVGIVKGRDNEVTSDVVVASVQTLARKSRLNKLTAPFTDGASLLMMCQPFDLVIVDEAHHATADSYKSILAALNAGRPGGPLLVGVTATPDRGDGRGLKGVFDEIVFTYDLMFGIEAGFLSDIRGLAVKLSSLDLTEVKTTAGDYNAGAAGEALEAAGAPAAIAAAWHTHAAGRRTLVFTPTVSQAAQVADAFGRTGVAAAWISGATDIDERRRTLARFKSGEIDVLANCAVLTEGFDEPRVDCIVIARPTKSRALYAQMVGRGTRKHPDKLDCLVLDVVGVTDDHSLITVPSLFGLTGKARKEAERGQVGLGKIAHAHQAELVAVGRIRAEEVELLRKMHSETGIAWVAVHAPGELRRYTRELGRDRNGKALPTVVLVQRVLDDDLWVCGTIDADGIKRVIMDEVTLETAQAVGEDFIRKHGSMSIAAEDAAWRHRPPSRKSMAYARRLGLPLIKGESQGELSDRIEARMTRARLNAGPKVPANA